MQRIIS